MLANPTILAAAAPALARISESGRQKLLTLKETADRLHMTTEQLIGFVDDGLLLFINVGRGKLRPRYRFAQADIDQFEETRRTRKEPRSCLSTGIRIRNSSRMTSGARVLDIKTLRQQRPKRTPSQ